jgi:hypothetical protein
MFTLLHWLSRSHESKAVVRRPAQPEAARPAAVEPLEGRQLMSASLLPAVQQPSYSWGVANTGSYAVSASPTASTNIIGVLIAL